MFQEFIDFIETRILTEIFDYRYTISCKKKKNVKIKQFLNNLTSTRSNFNSVNVYISYLRP